MAQSKRSALAATLDRSPLPLYLQAAELLRKRLERGEWLVGDRLPSLEQLMLEIPVARLTLRQALSRLEEDGVLECRQGRGTFVKRDISPQRRYRVATDWTSLLKGITEGTQQTLPSGDHAALPRLDPDDARLAPAYRFIKRLNLKDGAPYGFMSYYIANRVFDMNPQGFLQGPVLPALAELKKVRIGKARQTMVISTADAEAADLLDIPLGAPVVLARRVFVDEEGVAIFVCDITYRGDHVRFEVDLLPGSPFERAAVPAKSTTRRPTAAKRSRKS